MRADLAWPMFSASCPNPLCQRPRADDPVSQRGRDRPSRLGVLDAPSNSSSPSLRGAKAPKQSRVPRSNLDCFASLAMTEQDMRSPSRGMSCPSFAIPTALIANRGRGEGRVFATPMARLQQKMQAAGTTGLAATSGPPRAMALRLIRVLPGAPGVLATITCAT